MWMGVEWARQDRYVTQREVRSIDLSSGICHTLGKHDERMTGSFFFSHPRFSRTLPRLRFSFFLRPSSLRHLIVLRYITLETGTRVNTPSLVTRRTRAHPWKNLLAPVAASTVEFRAQKCVFACEYRGFHLPKPRRSETVRASLRLISTATVEWPDAGWPD